MKRITFCFFLTIVCASRLAGVNDMQFEFLTSTTAPLMPVEIIAPDRYVSSGRTIWLARVEGGAVQRYEVVAGLDDGTAEVMKRWRFAPHASGAFVVLAHRSLQPATDVLSRDALDNRPRVIVQAVPSYPRSVRPVISWKADVEVTVDKTGIPVSAKVLSVTGSDFAQSAEIAALFSRFEVGIKSGTAVGYNTRIEVRFDVAE